MSAVLDHRPDVNLNPLLRFSSGLKFMEWRMTVRAFATMTALCLCLASPAVSNAMDQEFARQARAQGVTIPFQSLLAKARSAGGRTARLLDARMFRRGRLVVVEIYLKRQDGRLVTVQLDGRTSAVLAVRRPPKPKKTRSSLKGLFDSFFGTSSLIKVTAWMEGSLSGAT